MKLLLPLMMLFAITFTALGRSAADQRIHRPFTDARPDLDWTAHYQAELVSGVANMGTWECPDDTSDVLSMEWPEGSGNCYLWMGHISSCCYGQITSTLPDSADKWASVSDYGDWELWPSEGYPLVYQSPGTVATEESWYGIDDWYTDGYQDNPYGLLVQVKNLSWDITGYDDFMGTEFVMSHHSEHGNPGVPLEAFVPALKADCDVATADMIDPGIDDLVYYDGHAIWANGVHDFEYTFADGTPASTQDDYIWQQNPDSPLGAGDPNNIFYHYNYLGSDGIPDNDVDQNGVSDHFTILAKVVGTDTLYITDPASGIEMFSEGMPGFHYDHVVGDTTYLVVPRNLSYMWDGDGPGTTEDDSGEQDLSVPCTGFIGWRLLDFYVLKADQTIERPADVWGYPIPLSHMWWNWESDPGTDAEYYDFHWGMNPDQIVQKSGPAYMADWYGEPNAPEAVQFDNPGPFTMVYDNPVNLGYPVFDYRFLISTGICTLEDGDELHVVGGWVLGTGLEGLRRNADLLLDAFYRDGVWGLGTGVSGGGAVRPARMEVYPNPSQGGMLSFSFPLSVASDAALSIYDLSGRMVAGTSICDLPAGSNTLTLDGQALRSGVYFAVVRAGDSLLRGKFAVVR